MTLLEQKKAEFQVLRDEIHALQEEYDFEVLRPKLERLVGTYWKYKNSYSCPKIPSDYWWAYRKVVKVSDSSFVVVQEFQTDQYGKIIFEQEKVSVHSSGEMSGWGQIRRAEWSRELKKVQTKIAKWGLKTHT